MARKRKSTVGLLGATSSYAIGPRGKQPRPGFAAAKAANAKGARGGGGSSSMKAIRGAGTKVPKTIGGRAIGPKVPKTIGGHYGGNG